MNVLTNILDVNDINYYYILLKLWEYNEDLFDSNIFVLYYMLMGGRTYDYNEDLITYSNSKLLAPMSNITFINFAKTLAKFKHPININFEPVFITLSQILNVYLLSLIHI